MMNSRQDDPSQPSPLSTHIGYITGPLAEQPLGVRVVEPPPGTRQHQRGSLFVVIELFGDHPDRNAIGDRLLSEVQRVYYTAKGSQSQVIVEALQQAQQSLREVNAHTPHYALQFGMMACALLGGRLLLAASGAAFALIRVSDKVHMFPSDPSSTLGGYGAAPVEVYRQDVQADDALFLGGGGWLQKVASRTLASIVAFTNAENCNDAADELYDQAGRISVPGLLIVLAADQEPPRGGGYSPSGGRPSMPGAPSSNPPRRSRFGGLPTALSTSPPARMPPAPSSTTSSQFESGDRALHAPLPPSPAPPQSYSELSERSAPLARMPEPEAPVRNTLYESEYGSESVPDVDNFDAHTQDLAPGRAVRQEETQTPSTLLPSAAAADEPFLPPFTSPFAASATDDEAEPAQNRHRKLESATGLLDLPQEPGDEVEPIFPPPPLPVAEPQGPSWWARTSTKAGSGLQKARAWVARMLPEREDPRSHTVSWETSSTGQAGGAGEPAGDSPENLWQEVDAAQEPTPRATAAVRRTREVEQRLDAMPVREPPAEMMPEGRAKEFAPVPPPPVLEMSPFEPPPPARGARARLFLLLALVVVVSVPAVVAAYNLSQGSSRRAEAEEYTGRAEILLLGAQTAMDLEDKVTARERLTDAQDNLAIAIELDGANEERDALVATIEAELQEVLQVIPLYGLTEPLVTFPAEARPQRVLVINESIFVIDAGREALLRYRYDPATGTVNDQLGQVILQQGALVDNVPVGTLVDMAWLPLIPGFEDRPSLLVTDRNNNVFRYDERVEGAQVMQFADRSDWGSIGQVQTYNGRIYLVDEAKGSILRYSPGGFQLPGEPWFSPETQVNLAGLLALEIDGDVWTLFSNGMILRYRDRQQLPFSPEQSIGLAEEPVDMYVTRQDSATVYLVDAGQERILVYEKSGAYVGQLRAPEGEMLRGLSGLYVDEVGGTMYILTQSGLFAHPLLP